MKLNFLTSQILLVALLLGCAHTPKKQNNPGLTETQVEQINSEALALALVSERLEQMVREAKNNKELSRFLATDLFLKANMSLMEGDFVTASVLFKHLTALVPEDDFVQKKYAVSLIRMGDVEASAPVLESLYEKSKEEKVGLILAGVYTGMDKERKARQIYQDVLKTNPKSEDACVFLGKSYAVAKETARALKLLQGCAKRSPKNGMFDYYIGKIHVDNGQMSKGAESFLTAHRRQPDLSQAAVALGVIYEEGEKYEKAIKVYRDYLKKNPSDRTILARMVHVLFLQEKYVEVISYAERLSDQEPDNLNLKIKLGILYTDVKKYDEALSIFRELLTHAPQSDKILYYIGAIHQELNQYLEAIEYFNQIPESSALYTDSSVQMASMLSTLAQQDSKWKESFLAHVNKSLERFKDLRVEFSVIKSGYYESMGKFKEAMEAIMVVQGEEGFSIQHKYYLANLYEREKKFEESTALIMGILENEPKNAHAWNFLGYAILLRGEEIDKAFEFINKAVTLSPDDGYIRDSLGWYYFKKGETKRALAELELALKKVPDDVEILKHLGEIHMKLHNHSKAKHFLEAALKQARYQLDRKEILITLEKLEKSRLPASREID